jgi:hypothetical protein
MYSHSQAAPQPPEPNVDALPKPLPQEGWETYKRRLTTILQSRLIVDETTRRQDRWSARLVDAPR